MLSLGLHQTRSERRANVPDAFPIRLSISEFIEPLELMFEPRYTKLLTDSITWPSMVITGAIPDLSSRTLVFLTLIVNPKSLHADEKRFISD